MSKAAFFLALAGVIVGGLLALAALVDGTQDHGHNDRVIQGLSAFGAVIFGVMCAALYAAGKRRGLMAVGLMAAGAWHTISSPLLGLPGGLLLLFAGVSALFGLDDWRTRFTEATAGITQPDEPMAAESPSISSQPGTAATQGDL